MKEIFVICFWGGVVWQPSQCENTKGETKGYLGPGLLCGEQQCAQALIPSSQIPPNCVVSLQATSRVRSQRVQVESTAIVLKTSKASFRRSLLLNTYKEPRVLLCAEGTSANALHLCSKSSHDLHNPQTCHIAA